MGRHHQIHWQLVKKLLFLASVDLRPTKKYDMTFEYLSFKPIFMKRDVIEVFFPWKAMLPLAKVPFHHPQYILRLMVAFSLVVLRHVMWLQREGIPTQLEQEEMVYVSLLIPYHHPLWIP
jgi:hypothetical protein